MYLPKLSRHTIKKFKYMLNQFNIAFKKASETLFCAVCVPNLTPTFAHGSYRVFVVFR